MCSPPVHSADSVPLCGLAISQLDAVAAGIDPSDPDRGSSVGWLVEEELRLCVPSRQTCSLCASVSFVVSLFGSFLAVTDGRHGRSSVTAVTTKDARQPNTRLATVK